MHLSESKCELSCSPVTVSMTAVVNATKHQLYLFTFLKKNDHVTVAVPVRAAGHKYAAVCHFKHFVVKRSASIYSEGWEPGCFFTIILGSNLLASF